MFKYDNPFIQWREEHKPDKELMLEILRWSRAKRCAIDALVVADQLTAWLDNPVKLEPDLIACLGGYGASRVVTKGWKDIPIKIPEENREAWDYWQYWDLPRLRSFQLSVVGGFLKRAGRDPGRVVDLMLRQLHDQMRQLEARANWPLEKYTPRDFSKEGIRKRLVEEGLSDEEEIKDAIMDILAEDDQFVESNKFDFPFELREQLEYFAYAMEHVLVYCFDEEPDLGLPNRQLFDELSKIDLNQLLGLFERVDPKLKAILNHLSRHNYNQPRLLNDEQAPDVIWWRHWSAQTSRKRAGR